MTDFHSSNLSGEEWFIEFLCYLLFPGFLPNILVSTFKMSDIKLYLSFRNLEIPLSLSILELDLYVSFLISFSLSSLIYCFFFLFAAVLCPSQGSILGPLRWLGQQRF